NYRVNMIVINLIRKVKSRKMIEEFENKYGSFESLERAFKKDPKNVKLHMDLEDWIYFMKNPDETIKDGKIVMTNEINIGKTELEIINFIKNNKLKSINELSKLLKKDNSTIQRKVNQLEKEGLITIKKGNKNSKIPVVNYDEISIAI
ncbi:MAG: winged helix-turn-helix transcriptional regulator, partial [Methanobrevibacter sp.]|nr:winged helix-turn-helix transcriptional regulator [Methanobrevibacter sp.]